MAKAKSERHKKQRPHRNYTNKNKTRANAKNIRTPHLFTHEKIDLTPHEEKKRSTTKARYTSSESPTNLIIES
jgi:hypothetical protein